MHLGTSGVVESLGTPYRVGILVQIADGDDLDTDIGVLMSGHHHFLVLAGRRSSLVRPQMQLQL